MRLSIKYLLGELNPSAKLDYDHVRELCNRIADEGVDKADGLDFATWLENVCERLDEKAYVVDDWPADGEEPDDEPEVVEKPQFYFEKKHEAEALAAELRGDPRVGNVRVFMKPYNGWHVVLNPSPATLSIFADRAAIEDGFGRWHYPDGVSKAIPAIPGARNPRPAVEGDTPVGTAPSPKGATGKVWEIADSMVKAGNGIVPRPDIIAACVAAGINAATAATQYSKWKKARGL